MTNKVMFYASTKVCKIRGVLFLVFPLSTSILDDSYNSRHRNRVLTPVFTENSVPELTKGPIQVLVHTLPINALRFWLFSYLYELNTLYTIYTLKT